MNIPIHKRLQNTELAASRNLKITSQASVITFLFFAFKYKETSGSLFAYWRVNMDFLFSNTQALIVVEINLFLKERPDSVAIASVEKLTACFTTLLG